MTATVQIRGVLVAEGLGAPQYSPTVQPITVPRGSDLDVEISVIDSYGEPVDLTSAAVLLTVRATPSSTDALISRLAVITDLAGGIAVAALSSAETLALAVGAYSYDVWLTQGNGQRAQLVPASTFSITAAVAQPGDTPTIPLPSIAGEAGKVLSNDGTNLLWSLGLRLGRLAIATSRVLTSTDCALLDTLVVECDTSGGPLTLTMPQLSLLNGPKILIVMDAAGTFAANPVTLAITGGGSIAFDNNPLIALPSATILNSNYRLMRIYLRPTGTVVYV